MKILSWETKKTLILKHKPQLALLRRLVEFFKYSFQQETTKTLKHNIIATALT